MPFVHVELIEGRTEEQLTNMVKDITEAVSKNAGAPKENIHVIVNELKKDNWTCPRSIREENLGWKFSRLAQGMTTFETFVETKAVAPLTR